MTFFASATKQWAFPLISTTLDENNLRHRSSEGIYSGGMEHHRHRKVLTEF